MASITQVQAPRTYVLKLQSLEGRVRALLDEIEGHFPEEKGNVRICLAIVRSSPIEQGEALSMLLYDLLSALGKETPRDDLIEKVLSLMEKTLPPDWDVDSFIDLCQQEKEAAVTEALFAEHKHALDTFKAMGKEAAIGVHQRLCRFNQAVQAADGRVAEAADALWEKANVTHAALEKTLQQQASFAHQVVHMEKHLL